MDQQSTLADSWAVRAAAVIANPAALVVMFSTTLFSSALLLFSVQPMFAKMALPALGGTPAVWAVSMCFFQFTLLAGYCYAHILNRRFQAKTAAAVHLTVLALTAVALPIGLPASLSEPPAGDAYAWLIGVLALGVGLPFFAVSATAPLLQAWFASTGHKDADNPYFLYRASNMGSLIALLAYPFVVERMLGLKLQSSVWSAGFVGLAVLIGGCAVLMMRNRTQHASVAISTVSAVATKPSNGERAAWIFFAALPSGLLTGVTTYITTDVASAPFIWVFPLAIYLLSFILVFKDRLAFNYQTVLAALPIAILLHLCFSAYLAGALAAIVAFFLATLVCHRELYLRRPATTHLTEFYIWMSAGGVVGGMFAALVAPQIFTTVLEFKLLLMITLLARPGVVFGLETPVRAYLLAAITAVLISVFVGYNAIVAAGLLGNAGPALMALIVVTLVSVYQTRTWPEHRALMVMVMIAAIMVVPGDTLTIHAERSFFGSVRVVETDQYRFMIHGTTQHGAERIKSANGVAATDQPPALYYHQAQPMAQGLAIARSVSAQTRHTPFTAGFVGLGSGSLAYFAEQGESMRFYEIDPLVARIAKNPKFFSYLSRTKASTDIVLGDARLTLQKESPHKFDFLLIDAFSSDAIPVHLLTREAFAVYFDKLAPQGLLALHVSNRYLDLEASIAATLQNMPDVTALSVFPPAAAPMPEAAASNVIFVSRNPAMVEAVRQHWSDARVIDARGATAWTDDFSDVSSALMRGFWKKQ